MFQSFSPVFLVLLLGARLSLTYCQEVSTLAENVTEYVTELPPDGVSSNITLEDCSNPVELIKQNCCSSNLGIDKELVKCLMFHRKNMPKEKELRPDTLIQYFSCLFECVYKAKNYIGKKANTMNIKRIKADANALHADDPRERDYMIEMYTHCAEHSAKEFADIGDRAGTLFNKACRPYYMLVFMCGKISCPHFRWNSEKGTMQVCEEMKEKCEQMQKR